MGCLWRVNTRRGRATFADQEASGEFPRDDCRLDVHALSVVAHAVDEESGRIERARLCPDHGEILDWLRSCAAPVRVAYEAGPTGFGLARALADAQIECVVAAPSKLIRPAGDRVKTMLVMPRI